MLLEPETLKTCMNDCTADSGGFMGGLGGAGAPPNVLSPTPFYDLAIQNFI